MPNLSSLSLFHHSNPFEESSPSPAPAPAVQVAAPVVKKNPIVTAIYDHEAEADDELDFSVGDRVEVLKTEDGGWWYGRCHGKEGLFPVTYVNQSEMDDK